MVRSPCFEGFLDILWRIQELKAAYFPHCPFLGDAIWGATFKITTESLASVGIEGAK